MLKGIGLAVGLAVVGSAVGYFTALSRLAPEGRIATAAVGAILGLIVARALWLTRHGDVATAQDRLAGEDESEQGRREDGPTP